MAQPQTSMDSAMQSIPPTGDATSDSILSKLNQREEEYNTQVKGLAKEAGELKMPEPPKLSAAPDAKDFHTSPMESFGSAAMFLATFGSLLTKHPLETALNSGAGVLNAYKQKDTTAFTNAMDKWKADTDNAWKQANWQNEMYKDMLNRPEAEARILAAGTKNSAALAAIQSKSLVDAAKATAAATQKLNMTMIKHDEYEKLVAEGMPEHEAFDHVFNTSGEKARDKKQQEEQAANFDFSSAKPTDVVPGTGLKVQAIAQYGDAIYKGAKPSQVGLGYGMNPVKKAVDNYIANKYPGFDMAKAELDYAGALKERSALAGRSTPAKIAVKEMDKLADPMVEAVKKLDPSAFPDWNSVQNAYQKRTGGADVVKAVIAVQEFKTAFTNLMVRNGVPTDAARAKADDLISANFSLDQIEAVKEQAKISSAAVIDALQEAKETIGAIDSAKKETDQSHPLPKEMSSVPDGTTVPDSSGVMWQKQGDKLVRVQ